jgi:hypothetical protein
MTKKIFSKESTKKLCRGIMIGIIKTNIFDCYKRFPKIMH